MDILSINVLRGPNYWSNYRSNLIVMKLDLLEYEYLPSNQIEGFTENLKHLIPSLYNHYCSENMKGGFIQRLEEGTWLGHVIEHVALELQWLAGMECGYGRTRSTQKEGVYDVVFSYEIENAGIYAAHAAFNLVNHLAHKKPYPHLYKDLGQLKEIRATEGLGPSTHSIVQEAKKRNIPCTRLDNDSMVMLGYGAQQKMIWATSTCKTSIIGADCASDKEKTKEILRKAHISVPEGGIFETIAEFEQALSNMNFPLVIKPADGNHGNGITTNINTREKAVAAFRLAKQISNRVIVERFIEGFDYRFLVINYKVVAVAKRTPAMITGTGVHTIQELIDITNQNPLRGENHESFLSTIKVDEHTLSILLEKGLNLDSVLPPGQILYLKHAANLSTGGTAIDTTNDVYPHTIFLAERIARLMHLNICGIDILAKDISLPLTERNGAVLEVNSNPGFRMHLSPEIGIKRNVAKPVIDMLFPANHSPRIPLVAVTGTNGKTTTVRLIAHLAQNAGFSVGFTSTEGIYINQHEIYQGDCSGPTSASVVLRDPLVNYAVLECARGGIIRSGLGFDKCSISVVTNISEDHLGQNDIHSLDDLARVKEVVPRSTLDEGYSILNADDDRVYQIKETLTCNVALFSMRKDNERIHQHCEDGGLAAYVDTGNIVIVKSGVETVLCKITCLPLSFSGKSVCMIQNILAASLAGVASGFNIPDIAKWLAAFHPTTENLPGRMNFYTINKVLVMLDYAHNQAAYLELKEFLSQQSYHKKIGIIAATGDRKPCDIEKIGYHAATIFDEIIIRHDKNNRGTSNEEQSRLLMAGIQKAKTVKEQHIKIISDENKALEHALHTAEPGTFVLYFPEDILQATDYLKRHQETISKAVSTA